MLCSNKNSSETGFTLTEVIAVVAIVTLLVTMIIPALAKTKAIDQSAVCFRNTREFAIAWELYAQNNPGILCNNYTIPDTLNAISTKKFDNWANNLMVWSVTGLDAQSTTNVDWVKQSPLTKYASDDSSIYKCPADAYLSAPQRKAGWKGRLRSTSMNALVGRYDSSANSNSGRSWVDNGAYRQFLRTSDIAEPSETWVTIEEHPDSINDGFFVPTTITTQWGDYPASHHKGGCTLSFADNHVEEHKWHSKLTKIPVTTGLFTPKTLDQEGRRDVQWLKTVTGYIPNR
jgi:prepilin-type N-terminal cleavage/methylation domain-containing protein/prepilin-type processing-associated H-X9-DG protein